MQMDVQMASGTARWMSSEEFLSLGRPGVVVGAWITVRQP
jgi:hypothetical protein